MSDILEMLRAELGDAVSTDEGTLDAVRSDMSGHRASTPPLAVVTPRSIGEVQAVMRIATQTRTPVVPRGAGSGLAGGATGSGGEIVLSLLRMNRVLEVSAEDELVVVEPGIINAELNRQLERYGLWFAPDPSSKELSTIGGNIATNAGGLLCAKYGVTRESVLALKIVLADGRLLDLGHRTVKGVTGYDLAALLIGSEGTLGIVVEATLRLRPRVAAAVVTLSATFDSVEDAAAASAAITAAHLRPAVMELIGDSAMDALDRHLALGGAAGSMLIVQFDDAVAPSDADAARTAMLDHGGRVEFAADPAQGERLLAVRRALHPAVAALGAVLIEDVSVPRSVLAEMFREISRIERERGIVIPTVAHAGDGNLHPNFVFDGPGVPDQIWAAADEVFRTALELGGTLTGEHGVGVLKRRWLRDELGDDQVDLQRELKRVFDPLGILNPGKVF